MLEESVQRVSKLQKRETRVILDADMKEIKGVKGYLEGLIGCRLRTK